MVIQLNNSSIVPRMPNSSSSTFSHLLFFHLNGTKVAAIMWDLT